MRSAERLLDLALERAPTLGGGRLVCIDGHAGSGKTTLAKEVASLGTSARMVHMDDLYPGWDGLPRIAHQLAGLLRPLARGEPGSYRRYDWHADRFAETVVVEPVPLLVLEGVGAGYSGTADLITVLAWVEAPRDVRMRRGLERDGEAFAPHWDQWARAEAVHFDRERTRERADLIVDGSGTLPGRRADR